MRELIAALCAERGVSGDEGRVRDRVAERLGDACELSVDRLGNLIARRRGPAGKNKLALFAHMDEVGLLVTRVTDEGLLRFSAVGIDPRALHGRRVLVGDAGLPAAVGAKAWHHLKAAEREAELKAEGLYLDIGASCRAEAEAVVSPGDTAVFDAPFTTLADGRICSRALDDRVGCALLIDLLLWDGCPVELTGVFTCGEEDSLSGATAAAFSVAPDVAVIVETTTAGDVDGAPPDRVVCALGNGPVVPFADRGALYDRGLFRLAFETAKANGIPIQTKEGVFGGNEARVVSRAGAGARTLALSVPCRYLHSASCLADLADVTHSAALLRALIPALASV